MMTLGTNGSLPNTTQKEIFDNVDQIFLDTRQHFPDSDLRTCNAEIRNVAEKLQADVDEMNKTLHPVAWLIFTLTSVALIYLGYVLFGNLQPTAGDATPESSLSYYTSVFTVVFALVPFLYRFFKLLKENRREVCEEKFARLINTTTSLTSLRSKQRLSKMDYDEEGIYRNLLNNYTPEQIDLYLNFSANLFTQLILIANFYNQNVTKHKLNTEFYECVSFLDRSIASIRKIQEILERKALLHPNVSTAKVQILQKGIFGLFS